MNYDIHSLPEVDKIVVKDSSIILDEMDFKTIEDRLLCESIIGNLESQAADAIKDMKAAQLPLIGTIRINPIKRKFRNSYDELRIARKHMTKSEYREHVSSYIQDIREEQENIDRTKLAFKRIRSNNKKKYDKLCIQFGRAYAEMFIYSIYLLAVVDFDTEWEEQYQSIKDE